MAEYAAMAISARYRPGQMLCEEDAPSDRLIAIIRGVASRHKALADGRRQTTGFLFPGDLIGLASPKIYACTVEAITEVEACQFKRPQFEAFLERYPEARQQVLLMTAGELLAA
jgi:CRP/FNR family transcriptional regulator